MAEGKKPARKPGDTALFWAIIPVEHDGSADARTVRIAAYPPRGEKTTPTVTLGIGYSDPDKFAKIFFEVTEENWKIVNVRVREALRAAADHENAPDGQTPAPARRARKAAAGS